MAELNQPVVNPIMAEQIVDVFPAKYDGIQGKYVACPENDRAQFTVIRILVVGEYGGMVEQDILIPRKSGANSSILIDAVRDD